LKKLLVEILEGFDDRSPISVKFTIFAVSFHFLKQHLEERIAGPLLIQRGKSAMPSASIPFD